MDIPADKSDSWDMNLIISRLSSSGDLSCRNKQV